MKDIKSHLERLEKGEDAFVELKASIIFLSGFLFAKKITSKLFFHEEK